MSAPGAADPVHESFGRALDDWLPLTYSLNAINRSMGHDDLYPFTLAAPIVDKLAFVHGTAIGSGGA
jgi:hypothetical protein